MKLELVLLCLMVYAICSVVTMLVSAVCVAGSVSGPHIK